MLGNDRAAQGWRPVLPAGRATWYLFCFFVYVTALMERELRRRRIGVAYAIVRAYCGRLKIREL